MIKKPSRRRSLRSALVLAFAVGFMLPESALAAGVTPAAATPAQREQAQTRFVKGRELFTAGNFAEALTEFEASLEIVASPNTRLYVARCHRKMGNLVPAYAELGRTLVEARELATEDPRYEKTAEAALEERGELAQELGFVEITITRQAPTTTVKVAGDEVLRGGWSEPVPVLPGTAEVVVETPGHAPISRSVEVSAGEKKAIEIDAAADATAVAEVERDSEPIAEAPASEATPLRPLAYVAGGVAVAGLATFVIAGAMANGTHSDLEQACGAGPCPPGHEDDISAGRTQQTFANIGLAVGVLGAAAAVTLFVISKPKSSTAAATATAKSTSFLAGPSFVGLRGTF
jgi:hypothetical protein